MLDLSRGSAGGDVVDVTPSVMSFLYRHALEQPSRTALVDGRSGESLSYGEFLTRVRGVGRQLAASGVRRGDRVGVLAVNSLPAVVLLFALADVGAIAVPQNLRLHPGEMSANLRDAEAAAIACDAAFAPLAGGIPVWDAVTVAPSPSRCWAVTSSQGACSSTLLATRSDVSEVEYDDMAHRS